MLAKNKCSSDRFIFQAPYPFSKKIFDCIEVEILEIDDGNTNKIQTVSFEVTCAIHTVSFEVTCAISAQMNVGDTFGAIDFLGFDYYLQ